MLKKSFAAAMQSLEKVPRSLKEVERALSSVQVGSAGSRRSFRETSVGSTDRATASAAKRGFAKHTLLQVTSIRAMRRAR